MFLAECEIPNRKASNGHCPLRGGLVFLVEFAGRVPGQPFPIVPVRLCGSPFAEKISDAAVIDGGAVACFLP